MLKCDCVFALNLLLLCSCEYYNYVQEYLLTIGHAEGSGLVETKNGKKAEQDHQAVLHEGCADMEATSEEQLHSGYTSLYRNR